MVRALDDLQVVLDHEQRVALFHQPVEDAHEQRHVVEMQSGRGLVEDQQAVLVLLIRQPFDEFQPLRFAAAEHVQRLAEREIAEPDLLQHDERLDHFLFAELGEKTDRLADRQLEHVVDGFLREANLQHMRLVAFALALRAADEDVAEKLHLDLLEAHPAAALATTHAGVEGKGARGEPVRHGVRRAGEKFADVVEDAEIDRRRGARRARERRLVDHHHLLDLVRAEELLQRAGGFLRREVFGREQISVKHVMHERALARARDAGDARQHAERKLHVDVVQVVLARTFHRDEAGRLPALLRHWDGLRAGEVVGGERGK